MSKKTVLVTGASSGMGRETAIKLRQKGYKVYAVARRFEKLEELELYGCIPIKMDITINEEVEGVIDRIKRENGGVDILVNAAGYAVQGSVEETSLEDAKQQFDVNLFGLARLTQLVLPYMRETRRGKIINITSIAGKVYGPLSAWYIASKHALEGWSDSLRVEVKAFGIDVVIVEPGAINTELISVYIDPMVKRSGDGAYKDMTKSLAKWSRERASNPKQSSPPSVIANVILKAIQAKRPKIRYAAGKTARTMLLSRKLLNDRIFDWLIIRFIG